MNKLYFIYTPKEKKLMIDNVEIKNATEIILKKDGKNGYIELELKMNVYPEQILVDTKKANLK